MKKLLLVLSLAFVLSSICACTVEHTASASSNWSNSADGVTECGGTYNNAPYKAISCYMENPTEEEAEAYIDGKVENDGYDIALAFFMAPNLQFRIRMDSSKGYTDEEAQWIVNELVKKAEEAGTYEDQFFVDTIKEFMENREAK